MENQVQSYQKELQVKKSLNTYDIIIPEYVENKIRYLCQQIWNTEWSGVLFYTSEGNFEDNSLKIICKDILPMDIGNSAYTEFNETPDIARYIAENPELITCTSGLVHSHSTFSTFFSGIDINTLEKEGAYTNHFVSLIVNNEGTYTAAITRKITSIQNIQENCSYSSFNNQLIENTKSYSIENDYLEWFNLNIVFEKDNTEIHKEINSRLQEIRDNKKTASYIKPQESYKQTSLFSDDYTEFSYKPIDYKKDKENESIEDFSIDDFHFDNKTIKSLLLQLLTGSIIIPYESKVDINKWVKNMPFIYEKRFGKGEEGMSQFRAWAESYIEYICWFTEDSKLKKEDIDSDEMSAICANDLIEELSKLPSNKYIKEYIEILERYTII